MWKRPSTYQLFDFVEAAALIVTLVSGIFTIHFWATGQTPPYTLVYWGTSGLFAVTLIVTVLKLQTVSFNRLERFSADFHNFTHFIRNKHHSLVRACAGNALTKELVAQEMKGTGQTVVNYIADALTASTGKTVSVCIKYIPQSSLKAVHDIEDAQVETLCRSTNTDNKRYSESYDCSVRANTHFKDLIVDFKTDFKAKDLDRYSEALRKVSGQPYLNSNPNWRDHYRTCIVVPIRIERRFARKQNSAKGFEVLALLCADAKSTSTFQTREMEAYTNFLKAFADACYQFLEQCLYYNESEAGKMKTDAKQPNRSKGSRA